MAQATKKCRSAVYEYFSMASDKNHLICQCQEKNNHDEEEICGSRISIYLSDEKHGPTNTSNLKWHLQRYHPELLKTVNEKDSSEKKNM